MNELTEKLREEFHDTETRRIYAEDLLNSYVATQIKVLREQAGWTQAQLAEKAGMKQERISVLEDVNYSSWTANVLKRLATAFDVRLSIKFESFGSFLPEFEKFGREALIRPSFENDPAFQENQSKAVSAVVASDVATAGAVHVFVPAPIKVEAVGHNRYRVVYPQGDSIELSDDISPNCYYTMTTQADVEEEQFGNVVDFTAAKARHDALLGAQAPASLDATFQLSQAI